MRTPKYSFTKFVLPSSMRGKTIAELNGHFNKLGIDLTRQVVAVERKGDKLPSKLPLSRLFKVPSDAKFRGMVSTQRQNRRYGGTPVKIPLFERARK